MSRTGENIYKRKDGRWEARYIKYYDGNGKAKYGYVYGHSYAEAKSKLIRCLTSIKSGPASNSKPNSFKGFDFWLDEWLKVKKVRVKEPTYIRYRNSIENHIKPYLGKYPIERISTALIEKFAQYLLEKGRLDKTGGLSEKSVLDILTIVKEVIIVNVIYNFTLTQQSLYGMILTGGTYHMNKRKYHTDPEILLAQGQAIMSSSDESKYLFRVFAVNMVLAGTPASQVGASAGFTKAAVTGWVKTVDEQGFEALRTQQKPGRPPKLTPEQLNELDQVLQSDPADYGFKVWDGPSLSAYIKSQYRVDVGVRQCQRIFHNLGYSRIRPQPYPSKGYEDTEEREAFKKNEPKSSKTTR